MPDFTLASAAGFFNAGRMRKCAGGVLCICGAAAAGSLAGQFKFDRPPPSVALVYFAEGKPSGDSACPVVDQKDKKFVKKLLVGRTGCRIRFKNSDSVDHNIYSKDPKAGVDFDAGLLPPGRDAQVAMDWKPDAVVKIGCKIHPKMQAYIANVSSSHYQIVEFTPAEHASGFVLENIPEKLTKFKIWFPKQDPIDAEIRKGETRQWEIMEKGEPIGTVKLIRK